MHSPTLDNPQALHKNSAADEFHVGYHTAAENAAAEDEAEDCKKDSDIDIEVVDEDEDCKVDSDIEAVDEDEDCKVEFDDKTEEEDDDEDRKMDSDGTVFDSQHFHSHLAGLLNWRRGLTVSDRLRQLTGIFRLSMNGRSILSGDLGAAKFEGKKMNALLV